MNIIVTTVADSGIGSLRHAIQSANSGDTIRFSDQLSGETIRLTSEQLTLDKDLIIDGSDAPGLTVSGNDASRVFSLERKKKATLKNFTIADGKTDGAGGGIDTRHESEIRLENIKVHNNTSELGGGLRVGHLAKATIVDSSFKGNDGTLTDKYAGFSAGAISHNKSRGQIVVKGTTFEDNKGFNGGAIYSFSSVIFTVEDSIFRNNRAENRAGGGAIFTDGVSSKNYESGLSSEGNLVIRNSLFEGNQAQGEGGALFLWGYDDDRAAISDTTFIDNVATENSKGKAKGGALWAKMGLDIRNVTFANNVATQQGGGIWFESKQPVDIVNSTFSANRVIRDAGGAMFLKSSAPINITNSTIAYNRAGRANGAFWFAKDHNVTMKNSILAFNKAETDFRQNQVGFKVKDAGGNLEFTNSSNTMRAFDDAIFADPLLGELTTVEGDLVHPLLSGSPAIDAGIGTGAPKIDQRGAERDQKIDIGAFEQVVPQPEIISPTDAPTFSPLESSQLVAYLKFNKGSGKRAMDSSSSGLNNYGTLVNGAARSQGAIALDGRNDAVHIRNSSDINLGTHAERTISLRFKADSELDSSGKQFLYEEGGSVRGLNIYLDKDKLYVGGWNQPTDESGWQGTWLRTDNITAGQWHRVDLVLEGGEQVEQNAIRGYLDGELFGSGEGSQLWQHSGEIGVGNINGNTRLHSGVSSSRRNGFTGKIDELMIFDDALVGSDVSALF